MPFVQAKCPECGGMLAVDDSKKAAMCQFCGEAFIVQEAVINNNTYNTYDNRTTHNYGEGAVVNVYEDKSKDFVIEGGVLKEYHGESLTPVIPEGVVAIGGNVFENSMITSVTFPSTLKEFQRKGGGTGPFYGCKYLKEVILPEGLEEISDKAFYECVGLVSVKIPDSVRSIGAYAFSGCANLASITIPDSVTSIGSNVFSRCTSLSSVFISENLSFIGHSAFSGCTSLASITIPNSVMDMGIHVFEECTNLKNVNIPISLLIKSRFAFPNDLFMKIIKEYNVCQHCGGTFKGLFSSKCSSCGKPKDY